MPRLRADQMRLSSDPFGVDDVVLIKDQLKVIDEAATPPQNCAVIYQMARFDQHLGAACTEMVFTLIDEQAVIGAHHQIGVVVQGAFGDHNWRKATRGAHRGLPDMADRLLSGVVCY